MVVAAAARLDVDDWTPGTTEVGSGTHRLAHRSSSPPRWTRRATPRGGRVVSPGAAMSSMSSIATSTHGTSTLLLDLEVPRQSLGSEPASNAQTGGGKLGLRAKCAAPSQVRPWQYTDARRLVRCDAHSPRRAHPPARRSHAHTCGDACSRGGLGESHCELRHAVHRSHKTSRDAHLRRAAPNGPVQNARAAPTGLTPRPHTAGVGGAGSGVGGERRRRSMCPYPHPRRPAPAELGHRLPNTHARATPRPSRTSSRES